MVMYVSEKAPAYLDAPFGERVNYGEHVHGHYALLPDNTLVRIVEFIRSEYWGERVLEVTGRHAFGLQQQVFVPDFRWDVLESKLVPVDTTRPDWFAHACAWRAGRTQKALEAVLPEPPSVPPILPRF